MSYLKHAQDLDMFGLSFFEISKMQNASKSSSVQQVKTIDQSSQPSELLPIAAELWLGIDSLGIRFYKKNKLRPEVFFSWCDIRTVTAHDKKVFDFDDCLQNRNSRMFVLRLFLILPVRNMQHLHSIQLNLP